MEFVFYLGNFSHSRFSLIVEKLFALMIAKKDWKYVIHVPLDVITDVHRSLVKHDPSHIHHNYRFQATNASLGSLVNLSTYFLHFALNTYDPSIHVELRMNEKCLIVFFYLDPTRKRM